MKVTCYTFGEIDIEAENAQDQVFLGEFLKRFLDSYPNEDAPSDLSETICEIYGDDKTCYSTLNDYMKAERKNGVHYVQSFTIEAQG